MQEQLQYTVSGHWAAGSRGSIQANGVEERIEFSAPPEFHGEPGYWAPEYFLLGAAASCFIATFQAIAGFSKFNAVALEVAAEGTIRKGEGGYEFTQVLIRPHLTIRDESERPRAARLLEKAEHACIISRSLKCPVSMEAQIELPPADAVFSENGPPTLAGTQIA
jgi:peroxiredoxin-like protein